MLGKARPASDQTRSDISRLLDPSYTTSYYTTQQQSTYGAYVDAQGNMHDPDYRHFPLIQHASQYSSSRRTTGHTRPHWELVDEEAGLLDADEDLPEEDPFHTYTYNNTNSPKRNSYGTYKSNSSPSPRHYPASHRSSSPSGGMRIYPRTTTSAGFGGAVLSSPSEVSAWSSSSCSESSSPSSTCSSVLRSPSAYEAASEKSRCRISASLKRKRRRSAATAASEKEMVREKRGSREFEDENDFLYRQEWPVAEEEEEEEELAQEAEDEAREERVVETGDDVPTCNEVLRRRWQALSLSIRFGMFRAERRIKRRVQSLI